MKKLSTRTLRKLAQQTGASRVIAKGRGQKQDMTFRGCAFDGVTAPDFAVRVK